MSENEMICELDGHRCGLGGYCLDCPHHQCPHGLSLDVQCAACEALEKRMPLPGDDDPIPTTDRG